MKYLLYILCLFVLNCDSGGGDGEGPGNSNNGNESPPNWDTDNDGVLDNYHDYEYNGSLTAKIYPNGLEGGDSGDMIAAFVDFEQRGVAIASEVPVMLGTGYAFLMMTYSNASNGEILTFQYYDKSETILYDCNETLEFTVNMIIGNVVEPYILTFTTGN